MVAEHGLISILVLAIFPRGREIQREIEHHHTGNKPRGEIIPRPFKVTDTFITISVAWLSTVRDQETRMQQLNDNLAAKLQSFSSEFTYSCVDFLIRRPCCLWPHSIVGFLNSGPIYLALTRAKCGLCDPWPLWEWTLRTVDTRMWVLRAWVLGLVDFLIRVQF